MITCSSCSKKNPNDANFCQNCGSSLEQVCARCGTRNAPDANFCKNCGHALSTLTAAPAAGERSTTPVTAAESERRFVTILFCDVVGSTAVGELLDPEEWSEIMNGMFERVIPAVTRYGGTVTRLMGDAVLALFGAPVAHEDDPYRAVLAGLDMVQDLETYQRQIREDLKNAGVQLGAHDLEVRVGINTGLAVVGEVGSGEKREYTAMGDAVNLAARMEQTADPGTVHIAYDTYLPVKSLVQAQPLDPMAVKGKREPLRTYRVLGLSRSGDRLRSIEGKDSPLVGRDEEFKRLSGTLAQLQQGRGQIVCLIGEGGLGKSRLIKELLALGSGAASGINWYVAESLSFESAQPFGLIQRLLRRVGGIARDDQPQISSKKITALLADLPPLQRVQANRVIRALFGLQSDDSQPQGEEFKRELFEALSSLAQSWAVSRPTVVVFEDVHWADSASVELINHLLSLTQEVPLLIVCAFRPYTQSAAWTVKQHAESILAYRYNEISLQPLTAEASNHLMGALLNVPEIPDKIAELLAEKSAGIPYFIEEIVRDLVESGALIRSGDGDAWQAGAELEAIDIPDNLEAVLVSRMDRLDAETRRMLQLAAVIGRSFYFRVLEMIAGANGRLEQHMLQLQQAGMILEFTRTPELQYMFRHVLAQEAAYNTILIRRRSQYHRQVGEAMEEIFSGQTIEQAPLLAHHFQQAGDDQRALNYYTMAAENAVRLYANEEAVNHYSKALDSAADIAPDHVSMARLYHGRGPILEVMGDFEAARTDLEMALGMAHNAGDEMLKWRILLDLGNLWTSRDYHEAGEYYEKALELARRLEDPAILARSLNRMGNWNANAEHPQQAITFHGEALEIIERLDDRPGLANTLDLLGIANLLAGNTNEAQLYFDRAVALFRELDDRFRLAGSLTTSRAPVTYNELAIVQSPEALDAAVDSANEGLQISKGMGWLAGESFALWVLSLQKASLGQYDTALDMVESGLRIATEIDHRQWMAGHEFVMGVLYCDLLDGSSARHHSQRALRLARETGSQYWTNQAAGALARADLILGDLTHCRATLSNVLSPTTPMDSHAKRYCWLRRAELALAEGEADLALEILDRLVASVRDLTGHVIPSVWRQRGQGLAAIGRTQEAEATLQDAVDVVIQGNPQLWRLHAVLGDLYWNTERRSEAEKVFTAGRCEVDTLAAAISDEQLKANFKQHAYAQLAPPAG